MAESDHDLLIRIDERTTKMDQRLANHLAHHWAITLGAIVAFLGAVGALITALVMK